METATPQQVNKFVETVEKSKVAVIVPLYGYWEDSPMSQLLNANVLSLVLRQLKSSKHNLYIIFVGESQRLGKKITDVLIGAQMGGNTKGLEVPAGSSYAEYLTDGIEYALQNTEAQFLTIFNPWVRIQEGGLDGLIDFANLGTIGIVSGYDVSREIAPEQFDSYNPVSPKDFYDINIDFVAMRRQYAEMLEIDKDERGNSRYRTHYFLPIDFVRRMFQKGFEVRTTQRVPVFPGTIDWTMLEDRGAYEADKQFFISKWGFDPSVTYNKP